MSANTNYEEVVLRVLDFSTILLYSYMWYVAVLDSKLCLIMYLSL